MNGIIKFSLKKINFQRLALVELTGKNRIMLLPFLSLFYVIVILFTLFISLIIAEKLIIPYFENDNKLLTTDWELENSNINKNNHLKIKKNPYNIWETNLFPTNIVKSKSKRIIVMGDSFVWGDGYANMNNIWWRQLQRELVERGYNDIEVIAIGQNGKSTKWQLEKIKEAIKTYSPDLVIWGYVTNDPDEYINEKRIVNRFSPRAYWLNNDSFLNLVDKNSLISAFLPNFNNLVINMRIEKIKVSSINYNDETGYPYDLWELKILEGDNFTSYRQTVKEVSNFIKSSNIPQFFITLPNSPSEEYFKKRYKPIKKLFKQQQISFYDILGDFIKKYGKSSKSTLEWGITPANGHPGKTATHFYAETTVDLLEKNYSDILPEKGKQTRDNIYRINDCVPFQMDLTQSGSSVNLTYPKDVKNLLKMPYKKSYIQLNFENPVRLSKIKIAGKGLKSSKMILGYLNSEKIDEEHLATISGNNNYIIKTDKLVDELKIMATFLSEDRKIEITFE